MPYQTLDGPTAADYRAIRDCQRPITHLCIWKNGEITQRRLIGSAAGPTGRCGKLYNAQSETNYAATACDRCAFSPALRLLLNLRVDPRDLALDD